MDLHDLNDREKMNSGSPEKGGMHRRFVYRYVIIAVAFLLVCSFFLIQAARFQIEASQSSAHEDDGSVTRTVKIPALRGEIFDRNGVPIVTNRTIYTLVLDYNAIAGTYAESNAAILEVLSVIREMGAESKMPESPSALVGVYPYMFYNDVLLENSATARKRLERILSMFSLEEDAEATELMAAIAKKYGLVDKKGVAKYSLSEMTELIRVRYEMNAVQFSAVEPYVVAEDIGFDLLTRFKELHIRGTDIRVEYERAYAFPGYASHILGRIGKIHAEDVAYYTELGYPVNAIVGNSGCELAFEEYLRGIDGEMKITEDRDGNTIRTEVTRAPVPGRDVYLTLDIKLQIAAEDALAENVSYIVNRAAQTAAEFDGEDADSGAIVAQAVDTGELLALASYPTYDLSTFNRDYSTLVDDRALPLFNRALEGTYAPGSTFKIGVAAAALTEEIVMDSGEAFTPETLIHTEGRYTYFTNNSTTPRCWIYSPAYNFRTHGTINVVEAIRVSCNCFFYEVGRLLGIDRINNYCRMYGLGQKTGIELPESVGVLADEKYALERGESMAGENTIRTAIGQGFSAFTPIQINTYISTIINGGTRYATHLLYAVRDFGSTEGDVTEPVVLSRLRLSDGTLATIKEGMSKVVEGSTSVTSFATLPVSVGGKTGTAQKNGQSSNAVFIAVAPLEAPEIAVTCVIEKGAKGASASRSVRTVMDCYFGYGEWSE